MAPDGYTIATDTTFTIDETGKVTSTGTITEGGVMLVEDAITNVKVSKTDIASGEELEGATIQIIDKDGKVVEEWVSTKEVHEVEGLKTGEEYTLHETVAPDGYTIAADTKFTIDESGKVTSSGTVTEGGVMLVEDSLTSTDVLKADEDGNILGGAKLQIQDENGEIVAEWTSSGDSVVTVKGLNILEHYHLIETSAPKGFKIADPIEFYLKEDGSIVSVSGGEVVNNVLVMIDAKVTTTKKVKTGDDMNAALWAALAAMAAAGAGIIVLARRKKNKS